MIRKKYWNVFYVLHRHIKNGGFFLNYKVKVSDNQLPTLKLCAGLVFHPILLLFHKLSRDSGSSPTICLNEALDTDAQI